MMSHAGTRASLQPDQVREIAARAATLAERLAGSARRPARADEPAALADWRQAVAGGDPAAFERRLGWDGLDLYAAAAALADEASAHDGPAPPWAVWLERFAAEARECAAEIEAGGPLETDLGHPEPPFAQLLFPPLRVARRALGTRAGAAAAAIPREVLLSLERPLVRELSLTGELALLEAFRGSRAAEAGRYRRFVSEALGDGLAGIFLEYPVLARHWAILVGDWVDATVELLLRLRADRADLEALFGRDAGTLVHAEAGLSDRHHGGRRVCIVGFASGLRLVYKPRDVGLERAFHGLMAWLAEHGLGPAPGALRALARDGHGWFELATPGVFTEAGQVEDYYCRAGALLCLAYLLRGQDLHGENLVATLGGPVLVDTEALLQPAAFDEDEAQASCLDSGLLSLRHLDANGVPYDVGGLREAPARTAAVARRVWQDLGADGLRFVEERSVRPEWGNRVVLGGVVQTPEAHARAIRDGFAEAYRFLLARRQELLAPAGALAALGRERTRVLFRPSDQYGAMLYLLASPRYQRSGLARSLAIERLNRVFVREQSRPRLWPLVADEQRSLEALDVPRFALPADSTVLTTEAGESLPGPYAASGLEAVRRRLQGLDEAGLVRQLEILNDALAAEETHLELGTVAPSALETDATADQSLLLPAAERLGREVRERVAPQGRLDLYGGQAGIGLFLAALAAVSGDAGWAGDARAAVEPLRRALAADAAGPETWTGIGAASGLGSAVYALACMGRLLGDGSLAALAVAHAQRLTLPRIQADHRFDVEAGAAGAILSLLALYAESGEAWLLERAQACGRRLLEAQRETGPDAAGWPGPDGLVRAGFAHGAAGIAYALARLHAETRAPELLPAVRRAWRHERRLYSPADRNWPVLRPGGGTALLTAWCHGAPGIALARALTPPAAVDAETAGEVALAVATTLDAPPSSHDHLCCGGMGRAEVLLVVGQARADEALVWEAQRRAALLAARVLEAGRAGLRVAGFESGAFRPGFFRGWSGIGYQLLRTAAPARLPSVLAFEAGTGRA